MTEQEKTLRNIIDQAVATAGEVLEKHQPDAKLRDIGRVSFVGSGVARVRGLGNVRSEELLKFEGNYLGLAFNLSPDDIGVVLLDKSDDIDVGSDVMGTGRVIDVPVGDVLLGRIIDPLGRPLDAQGAIGADERLPVERPAPEIMDRDPVEVPLQTGLKVVDALIPVGRGQRELIVGDRKTGKTAVGIDTIINQKDTDVICIYCAIGKKSSDIASVADNLLEHDAFDYSVIVASDGADPPGLQYIAPYAATSIGEFFRDRGDDVLIIYDDLSLHARAYRELSLLLRRPPAREAYPGDIFYIHSRLLERSTHLKEDKGGGSMTALPVVETQAQNLSAYIPTNLISITDGQIYLSPKLYRRGNLPAVDVGKSVSRVGGKTQLKSYREISGDLKLSYSQFEELETFARFSTRLDEETRKKLRRGERVREVLKQPQYKPIPVPEQVIVLLAVNEGRFDDLELDQIGQAESLIRKRLREEGEDISESIYDGEELTEDNKKRLLELIDKALDQMRQEDQS